MSICRAIDSNGDWLFGKGKNDYITNNAEIAQDIQTRLLSFLGDCFFDATAGIDWFNFLSGSKNQNALNLAVNSTILNTAGVQGMIQLSVNLSSVRIFNVQYRVQTVYSSLTGAFQYDLGEVVT